MWHGTGFVANEFPLLLPTGRFWFSLLGTWITFKMRKEIGYFDNSIALSHVPHRELSSVFAAAAIVTFIISQTLYILSFTFFIFIPQ